MFINRGLRLERNNLHSIIYQSAYKGGWQKYSVLLVLSSQSWVNKNSLTAAQLWWMKRRNAGVWETAGSAPRTTPTRDAPDLSAVGRSNLPWVAGLFGLARGDLCSPVILSSESITSDPLGPQNFSQMPPSVGLGRLPCPAVWALSEAGSCRSCCQTKLFIIRNHCLPGDPTNHLPAFSETIRNAKALQDCLFPPPGSLPG